MSNKILLSIFILKFCTISFGNNSQDLIYLKAQSERSNVINKAVWVNTEKARAEKATKDFIFRPNSLDVDNLLENNFDEFGENVVENNPFVSNFLDRAKRASHYKGKRYIRDSMKLCTEDQNCITHNMGKNTMYVKSKLLSKLRPSSLFNDYPYEIAILLGDDKIEDVSTKIRRLKDNNDTPPTISHIKDNDSAIINLDNLADSELQIDNLINDTDIIVIPKRSMNNGYDSDLIKKTDITEEISKILDNMNTKKTDRDIFKNQRVWQHNDLDTETPIYYGNSKKIKSREKALLKVLSLLSKTFKRIMKQHNDIRSVHNKLHNLSRDVTKNIADVTNKFKDIEEKYSYIVHVNEKFKEFESKLNYKEDYFKLRDREMSHNLMEFEKQQKKFLTQQRQFFNIQKLMLAQNEKITKKQNMIAKVQSDISHRQNNFARILKKAKQIYTENSNDNRNNIQHENSVATTLRPLIPVTTEKSDKFFTTTTEVAYTTDSIKINLFSIPIMTKLDNQDNLILKEKDEKPVDDLIYKYYFNNTFIDTLMKSKVLSNYMTIQENSESMQNLKNKRDDDGLHTTILFPIRSEGNNGKLNRDKRWIRHSHSKLKQKRKSRGKNDIVTLDINDARPPTRKHFDDPSDIKNVVTTPDVHMTKTSDDPFTIMAKSFCVQIKQNTDEQVLNWCMEKALRRLQHIDMKIPPQPLIQLKQDKQISAHTDIANSSTIEAAVLSTTSPVSTTAAPMLYEPIRSLPDLTNVYFPDNDELEMNLKAFELKPDTEGTVYFDGSIHTSDLDGFSDIMPGLDSNSRVEMSPLTLDLKALRRNSARGIEEMKNIFYG